MHYKIDITAAEARSLIYICDLALKILNEMDENLEGNTVCAYFEFVSIVKKALRIGRYEDTEMYLSLSSKTVVSDDLKRAKSRYVDVLWY